MSISRGIDLFLLRAVRKVEKLPQTYILKYSISSAFSDKLTIVCSFDSLILLDHREGEEREICKLQEAMRPFSNNNTERPIGVRAIFCQGRRGAAVNHLPKKFS